LQTNFGFQQVTAVLRGFTCFRVCKVNFVGWLKLLLSCC